MFGGSGATAQKTCFALAIEINKGECSLILRGALALVNKGYTPYLFRYSKKRNRTNSPDGVKAHGEVRNGWNVVDKADTLTFGPLEQVLQTKYESQDDQRPMTAKSSKGTSAGSGKIITFAV